MDFTVNYIKKLLIVCFLFPISGLANTLPSIAFFYGYSPPVNQLKAFDAVVVQPTANIDPTKYNTKESQLFAYVSLGELEPTATYRDQIPKEWLIGTNSIWKSKVIDQSQKQWPKFFVDHIVTPLWAKGYRGFFFDTVDSYQLAATNESERQKQLKGLIATIQAVKARYPSAQIILNRGFELLPSIHKLIYAVAAESLFASWNEQKKQYVPVKISEQEALLKKLREVQALNLPVVVIDYVDPADRTQAIKVAKKILDLGMIPWVTDGHLQTVGISKLVSMPRKILIIYSKNNATVTSSAAFNSLAMPLEYLGYVPEFHEIDEPLPQVAASNGYAGIVFWAQTNNLQRQQQLYDWVAKEIKTQTPIVFMEQFGFNLSSHSGSPLGLIPNLLPNPEGTTRLRITQQDKSLVGFETDLYPNDHEFLPLVSKNSKVLLQLTNQQQDKEDAIAITPWGGYALMPYVQIRMPGEQALWVINPIQWLSLALHRQAFPIPDVTTENGRRMMMAHLDGDGFATTSDWPYGTSSATVLQQQILEKYQIPTTVSVITGEIAKNGLYPQLSPMLTSTAQAIFKLPWVESASHTFSSPSDWIKMEQCPINGKYNLPIKNYQYNVAAEITGSISYINQKLVPPGKQSKILLWSGESNPDQATVKLAYDNNLLNMNGGNTDINNTQSSLTRIQPLALSKGPYLQIYSPIASEISYTNGWNQPFYGFERVIETFKLTDTPHRFKPIDIYYHFFSGSKHAAITALDKVYQWALSQPVINFFESEYIPKVIDFYNSNIATTLDGGWQVDTQGALRELRIPVSMGYPDLEHSTNIIGYSTHNDSYYLHLGEKHRSLLYFTEQKPTLPYLSSANGVVTKFLRTKNEIQFSLQSHLPLQLVLGNMKGCQLWQGQQTLKPQTAEGEILKYTFANKTYDLHIRCS